MSPRWKVDDRVALRNSALLKINGTVTGVHKLGYTVEDDKGNVHGLVEDELSEPWEDEEE